LETVAIPALDLFDLDAKIDTGADSSALHCDDIFIDDDDNVHFKLLDEVHPAYNGKKFVFPLYKLKKIKSSNGELQQRPSIKTDVVLMGKKYKATITLTNRSDMKFPMLIGRKFLSKRYLVDVSLEYNCKTQQGN
jgi:hypothetical protein